MSSTEVQQLMDGHRYCLAELGERYTGLMVKHRFNFLDEEPTNELAFKYPGFICKDIDRISCYKRAVLSMFNDTEITPRGYIGEDTVAMVGIAPGFADLPFVESAWMYGPSTSTLHKMMDFSPKWYFTNISKKSFQNNAYSPEGVDCYFDSAVRELQFFKGCKIVFLGKYEIYDEVKKHLDNEMLSLPHPSFINRVGPQLQQSSKEKLRRFVEGSI